MEPDLDTRRDADRAAATARGGWGLMLAILGGAGLLFHWNASVPILESQLGIVSLAFSTIGWALLIDAIIRRSLWHKMRMRDG